MSWFTFHKRFRESPEFQETVVCAIRGAQAHGVEAEPRAAGVHGIFMQYLKREEEVEEISRSDLERRIQGIRGGGARYKKVLPQKTVDDLPLTKVGVLQNSSATGMAELSSETRYIFRAPESEERPRGRLSLVTLEGCQIDRQHLEKPLFPGHEFAVAQQIIKQTVAENSTIEVMEGKKELATLGAFFKRFQP